MNCNDVFRVTRRFPISVLTSAAVSALVVAVAVAASEPVAELPSADFYKPAACSDLKEVYKLA